jgi:hypothetical protein
MVQDPGQLYLRLDGDWNPKTSPSEPLVPKYRLTKRAARKGSGNKRSYIGIKRYRPEFRLHSNAYATPLFLCLEPRGKGSVRSVQRPCIVYDNQLSGNYERSLYAVSEFIQKLRAQVGNMKVQK